MARLPDFTALILDMDGLLLDTEITYLKAWKQAALSQGHDLDEQFCLSLTGLQYQAVEQQLIDYCAGNLNLDEFRLASGRYWRQHVNRHGIALRFGFESLLEVMHRLRIPYCLATNSLSSNANECLQFAGVRDLFPDIVSRDQVSKGKPAPDVFIQAAKLLDVEIKDCLVVEDSVTGIEAARNAGAYSIFIPSILPVDAQAAEMSGLLLDNLAALALMIEAGNAIWLDHV
jgi:beta-phosphoglucomutase-like phosphatase (HAD superfamily)